MKHPSPVTFAQQQMQHMPAPNNLRKSVNICTFRGARYTYMCVCVCLCLGCNFFVAIYCFSFAACQQHVLRLLAFWVVTMLPHSHNKAIFYATLLLLL